MLLCHIVSVLPFVLQQQNVKKYWRKGSTAMLPTAAFDVVGQHNKIGGIIFRAAFVFSTWILDNLSVYLPFLLFIPLFVCSVTFIHFPDPGAFRKYC